MFESFHERRLINQLKKQMEVLSYENLLELLGLYLTHKMRLGILGPEKYELAMDNPFIFPDRCRELRKTSLKISKDFSENRTPRISIDMFICLFGIIYSPKSIEDLKRLYDILFVGYDARQQIIDSLMDHDRRLMIIDREPWSTNFLYNCIAWDPIYPSFIIDNHLDDELRHKVNGFSVLFDHSEHNTKKVIENAIICRSGFLRTLYGYSKFDELLFITDIISELLNFIEPVFRFKKAAEDYNINYGYEVMFFIDLLIHFVNYAQRGLTPSGWGDAALWISVKKYHHEIIKMLPKQITEQP